MEHFNMYVPTHTLFGAGTFNDLHKQSLPGHKALLVISNGRSTRSYGYLSRIEDQFVKAGIDYILFDQVEANPLVGTIMNGGPSAMEYRPSV